MATIKDIKKNDCCGCGTCCCICPKKAIKMVENSEGFLYPEIDEEKCIKCGLCKKKCPIISKIEVKNYEQKAYAIKAKNRENQIRSSSGGFFSTVAEYVLDNCGYVYGVEVDNRFNVNHIRIDSKDDIKMIRGSKYVQSNILTIMNDIREKLDNDNLVLFVGTPCQVAGLYSFIGKKYENLITCDLICHGVPSPKLFKEYIKYLEKKYKKTIAKYEFRNKEKKGWGYTSKITFTDKTIKYINNDFDIYCSNFLENNISRESCYTCRYSNLNRVGDITMGDYWGVSSIHKSFNDRNGVSLIIINSEKGEKYFNNIKDNLLFYETNLNYAIRYNNNLSKPSKRGSKRNISYGCFTNSKNISKTLKINHITKKIIKLIIPSKIKTTLKNILRRA